MPRNTWGASGARVLVAGLIRLFSFSLSLALALSLSLSLSLSHSLSHTHTDTDTQRRLREMSLCPLEKSLSWQQGARQWRPD